MIYFEQYKTDPRAQMTRVERFIDKDLGLGPDFQFGAYNQAARPRYSWLAKLLYRVLRSRGVIRRALRAMISHSSAAKVRHRILNFNRVVAHYEPINDRTADEIRMKLDNDRRDLIGLLGHCPWGKEERQRNGAREI